MSTKVGKKKPESVVLGSGKRVFPIKEKIYCDTNVPLLTMEVC